MSKEKGFPDIGKRLHTVRGEVDQRGFSRLLNVSQQAISNYERGNLPASWAFIRRINEEFNINLNWLFTGRGERDYRAGSPYASLADNRPPGWPRNFLDQPLFQHSHPLEILLALYFLYLATEPADAKARLMRDFQAIADATRGRADLSDPSDEQLAELAACEALSRDDRRAAVQALVQVGEAIEASGPRNVALPRARRAYCAALSLAEAQGWAEESVDAARRVARTFRKEGRWEEAERCFESAIALCENGPGASRGEGAEAGVSPATRTRAFLGYGHVAKHQGRIAAARERYMAALRHAMESQDPGLRAEVYLDLVCLAYHEREWQKGLDFLSSGRAFAEQAGDRRLLNQMRLAEALILRERGELESAEAVLRVVTSQPDAHPGTLALAMGNLAEVLIDRGALTEAEALLRQTEMRADRHGDPRNLALRKLLQARLDAAKGEEGAAHAGFIDAMRYARDKGLAREFDQAALAFERVKGVSGNSVAAQTR